MNTTPGVNEVPNGSTINSLIDDPVAAKNHAQEQARQEICRGITADVLAKHKWDPLAVGEFITAPPHLKAKQAEIEKEIAAKCREAYRAAGLLP
jgi:hypothetical protein